MTTTSSSTLRVGFSVAEEAICMRSIVCHKVGIDEDNPEFGRALEHADVCI